MPTSKQTTTERLNIPAPGAVEQQLTRLAMGIFSQMAADPESPVDIASIFSSTLGAAEMGAIADEQAATVAQGRLGLDDAFADTQNQVYDAAAARGALDSSFTAREIGTARRGYMTAMGSVTTAAAATAAQRIQQAISQQKQIRLSLFEGNANRRLAMTNPGLLESLMRTRLAGAERVVTSKTETPFDPTALLSGIAGIGSGVGYFMNRKAPQPPPDPWGPADY